MAFFSESKSEHILIVCLSLYCRWPRSIYQEGEGLGDPNDYFNHVTFCSCFKPERRFPSAYVVVIFVFNDLCRDVAICFVDIGGMADHTV